MRKQYLYVRKPGFYYSGPGNIRIGPGSKGTVFFWFHPTPDHPTRQTLWKATGDSANYLRAGMFAVNTLSLECWSGGTLRAVTWSGFDWAQRNYWQPVTCTWDFTTPGAGTLRLYVNGQEAPTQVNNASAPLVEATRLYLGAPTAEVAEPVDGCYDNLAVWDGVMTEAQHDALWGQAANWADRQAMRRRLVRASDGTGALTLLATFDGSYEARVAGGSAQAAWEVTGSGAEEFCRLDDGSRGRGLRHQFFFGRPRHDNTSDDRVPLQAVLTTIKQFSADLYTTIRNEPTYSQIEITQLKGPDAGQGMGWLREWIGPGNLPRPATVRMRVNLPADTNPVGTKVSLGPLCHVNGGRHGNNSGTWGTGELFAVVADGANTTSSFKTNLPLRTNGYWVGAELTMRTGATYGTRLKVTGYTASTGVITVSGALPAVPAASDRGIVDFRGRLLANASSLNELQNMEAWLWEEYSADKPWIELEGVYSEDSSNTLVRYQRGRTVFMGLGNQRADVVGRYMMFGRSHEHPYPSSYRCDLRIESLAIEGPGSYQVMSARSSALGKGFEAADTFMVRDPETGHSSRAWRWEKVGWRNAAATLDPNLANVETDLALAGSWRNQAIIHSAVEPRATLEQVTALISGRDPGGVWRAGYVLGQWNQALGRVTWQDEPAPAGRSNPFVAVDTLRPWVTRDAVWGLDGIMGLRALGTPDGKWCLVYGGTAGNPDHYQTRLLHGAADRWSFDREAHWWEENPVLAGMGGVEKLSADGGTVGLWGNRDADWVITYNPYTRKPERRYVGYTRFKTMLPMADLIANNRRPLAGWTSGDLKGFCLLPHGNVLSPLASGDAFTAHPRAVSEDFTALLVTAFTEHTRLWATDDDRHMQAVHDQFIPTGGIRASFVLGDKLVLLYDSPSGVRTAYVQRDREAYYDLVSGATRGVVETAVLGKPAEGWGHLLVNSAPNAGTLLVEVLDPETDEALAGLGAGDCAALTGGIEETVSWDGTSLADVPATEIRLRFILERTVATDASPALYGWSAVDRLTASGPTVSALRVEGRMDPVGVTDPSPTFSWTYADGREKAQQAYQVLVASSAGLLAANQGDIWDSGPVAADIAEAEYGGPELTDETTYFWKVRVQNSEGVWSEEW